MTIGVWGDSIVYGSCDSDGLGWVGHLRTHIPTDDNYKVYNHGICGDSSRDILRRLEVEYHSIAPTVFMLSCGVNDAKHAQGDQEAQVSHEEFKNNIEKGIRIAHSKGSRIFLIGPTLVDENFVSQRGSFFRNDEIEVYSDMMKQVAHDHKVEFIEMIHVIDPHQDLCDGVHPNAEAYRKMFKYIISQIDFL